jgi:WD40 repeat protein
LNDPVQTLIGHRRKVGTVNFHPTAENIVATSSNDFSVKIWDIEKGAAAFTLAGHSDIIQSVAWDYLGTSIVTTSKDKKLRILDPRSNTVTHEVLGHPGLRDPVVSGWDDETLSSTLVSLVLLIEPTLFLTQEIWTLLLPSPTLILLLVS